MPLIGNIAIITIAKSCKNCTQWGCEEALTGCNLPACEVWRGYDPKSQRERRQAVTRAIA